MKAQIKNKSAKAIGSWAKINRSKTKVGPITFRGMRIYPTPVVDDGEIKGICMDSLRTNIFDHKRGPNIATVQQCLAVIVRVPIQEIKNDAYIAVGLRQINLVPRQIVERGLYPCSGSRLSPLGCSCIRCRSRRVSGARSTSMGNGWCGRWSDSWLRTNPNQPWAMGYEKKEPSPYCNHKTSQEHYQRNIFLHDHDNSKVGCICQ